MITPIRNIYCITFLIFLLFSAINAQQTDNGSLSGTVKDPNGQVVAGASIAARNTGTGSRRTATADGEGRWSINVLSPGVYEIKVEAPTFQVTTQSVTVSASSTAVVNTVMGIEAEGAVVTVDAGDQNSTLSTEQSPVTGTTITGRTLEAVPTANRSSFGLLGNDTSVSGNLTDPLSNGNGNPEVSINGNRTTSVGVLFNGIDATNLSGTGSLTENFAPAPETVQEVKVLTSLYDASLGRNGGGNVQVVTRSGTNQFNGTAYIYAQNEKFNANDFFYNRDGIDRQRARRIEGGGTIGGSIIKDKLFFFGGYQHTDAESAYVSTAQSYVVLPLALAFTSNRSPEALRIAFRAGRGDTGGVGFDSPACITTSRIPQFANTNQLNRLCIDPFGPGYKLFTLRNPVTGGYLIPSLTPGRYSQLYLNPLNTTFDTDPTLSGFDINKIPLLDLVRESSIAGGNPLARFRNVSPAEFKQDQATLRLDYNLFQGGSSANTLYGTFFFANFPAIEPFSSDISVSPFPLKKDDKNRTLAITDQHVFNDKLINEIRFGYFKLDNTRRLDERMLTSEFTNTALGIDNPASFFAPGDFSERCGRLSGRGNIQDFQVCASSDIFNKRDQTTLTFADNVTYTRGQHGIRFGVEYKRNSFETDLPEEQGGDFEKLDNFSSLLLGYVPEADTAFGISDKSFRFNDLSFYVSDDWKVASGLTLNLGFRWDWFGLPTEKNGRIANFDPSLITDPNDIRPGLILPDNTTANTGFVAIDESIPTITKVNNKHTLNGQDLNNFAPRVGFAWVPFKDGKTTIRGGYGIFYDRPSGSFINTLYKNYPFFREIESHEDLFNPFALQYDRAFGDANPLIPFSSYLPFRTQYVGGISVASPLQLFDSRPITTVINGNSYSGGRAEPLEVRAVDRDLKTPLIQQWNFGIQRELWKGWTVEARYVGSKGQNLLLAVGFNQAYDLNDPTTPDYIFERLNQAYLNSPLAQNFPLREGATARERGCGIAFGASRFPLSIPGFPYPAGPPCPGFAGPFEYNFDAYSNSGAEGTDLIPTELRVPYLGLDPVESVMLQSRGYSSYHSGNLNVSKRFSKGVGMNFSYTWSKSIDIGSTDPGSTAASGRPDTPNLGLVVQGDQRNINSNKAVSDFDRPHRFSSSYVWELPSFGSKSKFLTGWQLSGFGQWQSGTPFTILASDVEFVPINQTGNFQNQFLGIFRINEIRRDPQNPNGSIAFAYTSYNSGRASGTLFNAGFGRPNVRSLQLLRMRNCPDITLCYFNTGQNPNDPNSALLAAYGRFGNLPRNALRGPSQKRVDLSLQKTTKISDRVVMELKWDIFNLFNFVNFANPNADLTDETDFGQITNTVGSPRVMQFGLKLRF
ncbi:MAG: carboxypeptidase regulatory-like domain-containing protein [Chloracidobacterium sp.]|nr:carboxypeptidase regulatory-like domain-containing protein [Chloracidobacterium sp.]